MVLRQFVLLIVLGLGMAQTAVPGVPIRFENLVSASGVLPGGSIRLGLKVELPAGFHVQSNAPRDPTLIPTVVVLDPPAGLRATEIVFPPARDFIQEGAAEPLAVFEQSFVIGIHVEVERDRAPGPVQVPGRIRYQTCDDKVCFRPVTVETNWTVTVASAGDPIAPQHAAIFEPIAFGRGGPLPPASSLPAPATAPVARGAAENGTADALARFERFTVRGKAGGYMNTDDFLRFIADAEAGIEPPGLFDGRSVFAILAIVFAGGIALNLTPCVLPMIPINLAIIGAGTQSRSRGRGFLLGSAYGGAMAVVYGALGLVVILTAGTFGAINASPWFNAAIAALFVVLALAMFDVITIDFSRWSSGIRFSEGSRGTYLLAFGMGAVAALLAGACVAPVLIQVILFASDRYAAGASIALGLPFLLGLGMALPWPIAGAGLAALPRPGAWMVRVKYVFGIFILGTAVYYGAVAYGIFSNRWVDPAVVAASADEKLKEGWHASLADGLRVAERDRTPVLIDLWATWCKNCVVMDRTTLADPRVVGALSSYTKIKLQAEDLEESPAKEVMTRVDAIGLPTYVILHPAAGLAAPVSVPAR